MRTYACAGPLGALRDKDPPHSLLPFAGIIGCRGGYSQGRLQRGLRSDHQILLRSDSTFSVALDVFRVVLREHQAAGAMIKIGGGPRRDISFRDSAG